MQIVKLPLILFLVVAISKVEGEETIEEGAAVEASDNSLGNVALATIAEHVVDEVCPNEEFEDASGTEVTKSICSIEIYP